MRSDPFEIADQEGMDYDRWRLEHVFLLVPAQQYVAQFLGTFKEFPPSQKAGSFGIDQVLKKLSGVRLKKVPEVALSGDDWFEEDGNRKQ